MGVTRPNVIWGRNLRCGSGIRVRVSIVDTGTGRVAEMVDPHISKWAANKQLAPVRRKALAAGQRTQKPYTTVPKKTK